MFAVEAFPGLRVASSIPGAPPYTYHPAVLFMLGVGVVSIDAYITFAAVGALVVAIQLVVRGSVLR